jgi:UDP-glucose 4-epimerase
MRIAVTGAAGNVGYDVAVELRESGHDVVGVDLAAARPAWDGEHRIADLEDQRSLQAAFEGCGTVVHLAAVSAPWLASGEQIMRVNAVGTYNALTAAAKARVKRFVFASSEAALGLAASVPDYIPIDERHPLRPQHPYGLSKVLGEEICRSFSRSGALSTVCLRTCYVWSPERIENALGALDDPQRARDALWAYVHIRDCTTAYRLACGVEGLEHEVLFVAAADACARRPTQALLDEHFPGLRLPEGAAENASLISHQRAREVLGFEPTRSWRDDLQE